MRIRTAFGLAWSLAVGLAGAWLVLSPWALAEQAGGDWSTVTRSLVGAGLGLVLLALGGVGLVVADVVGRLREAGVLEPRAPTARAAAGGAGTEPEMEQALLELAQTLSRELAQPRGEPSAQAPEPGFASWREQQ